MKRPCLSFLLFLVLTNLAIAQFVDDFDDGDINSNPVWQGTLHLFSVNDNGMLQLNGEDENEAFLFTESKTINNTEWNFRVNLAFAPSTNNYLIVWLVADADIPDSISSGYYLKFGEAGSSDAIELYAFSNDRHERILRGTEGNIASSFYKDIKIENDEGKWRLFTKDIEYEYYTREADGAYDVVCNPKYFGLYCKYTSSNSNKFYFDNFVVKDLEKDTNPPLLLNIIYKNKTSLIVQFSKAIANGDNKYNYSLYENMLYPDELVSLGLNGSMYLLKFPSDIIDVSDNLCISNLYDYYDNSMRDTCVQIVLHEPKFRDIVINEIMFDVNPAPNSLPATRYIELFNTTEFKYDISSWQMTTSDRVYEFQQEVNVIDDYLLLSISKSEYEYYENMIGFSSLVIKSADTLCLLNETGKMIDKVRYNQQMFFSDEKFNGGWSLEQIDPYLNNSTSYNWHECIDDAGGTPMGINSVYMKDIVFGEMLEAGDLLINEVLFNSHEGLSDYVEVINVSDKIISLRDVDFCIYTGQDVKIYPVGLSNNLIYPKEIKLISSKVEELDDIYPYSDKNNFIVSNNFPNLKNDESFIGLQNKAGEIIDKMYYNANMHFVFLQDVKGVSLERLSVLKDSNDRDNWHSCAQTYNFASPGVENSHYIPENINNEASVLEIFPKIFSPNNDGIDDILEICCNFNYSEAIITICIFNIKGFQIKNLVKNESVNSSPCFLWDGVGDNGMTVPVGNYIVVLDVITAAGEKNRKKEFFSVRY